MDLILKLAHCQTEVTCELVLNNGTVPCSIISSALDDGADIPPVCTLFEVNLVDLLSLGTG